MPSNPLKKNRSLQMLILLLSALLAVSVFANVLQYVKSATPRTYAQSSLVGTYCTGDERMPGALYYTFMPGDVYYSYQQGGSAESGRYSHVQDSYYGLAPLDANKGDGVLLSIGEDGLDLIGEDGQVVRYAKISDTPMFVGLG